MRGMTDVLVVLRLIHSGGATPTRSFGQAASMRCSPDASCSGSLGPTLLSLVFCLASVGVRSRVCWCCAGHRAVDTALLLHLLEIENVNHARMEIKQNVGFVR